MRRDRCHWYYLRIAHDRVGSSTDPVLNGHLKYPNNLDQSLNDATADKIRKYRADYNNRPSSAVSFIPAIPSTSRRLHSEFVRLLFLQSHRETDRFFAADRETDRFFAAAGVQLRMQLYVLRLIWMGRPSLQEHTLTHHTRKPLVY